MGILCIILGLLTIVGFSGLGYLFASKVLGNTLYLSLFALEKVAEKSPQMVYIVIIGVCAFFGLVIGLGLIMNGMIHIRLNKVNETLSKLNRNVKKLGKANIEE